MESFNSLTQRLVKAMDVPGLQIPAAGVKLYRKDEEVSSEILKYQPDGITVTSCHAIRLATLGDAVYLTRDNIGCVAASISLGLVDENQPVPFKEARTYTEVMRENSGKKESFVPPSPLEFTNGTVYACRDSGREDFGLFGKDDSGRYKKKNLARHAILEMPVLQPPVMQGIFYFSPEYDDADVTPDLVLLSVRPVELCRIIQGYQFLTGERVKANVGGLRAGCSDLIVQPYLTGDMNFSPYCLGARLIARFEGDRMGLSIPFALFETVVQGTEESMTGFPFPKYPGARPPSHTA